LIVLGVDPGTAATGYGVVSGDGSSASTLLECGVIRTTPSSDLATRLLAIHDGLNEVISRHRPAVMAVESVFHSRNARTTLVLGHARGVILLAAKQQGLEIYEYPPASIKKAIVGTGMATKEQVQFMVARLLRLKKPPEPSDAADGVAAALAHLSGASLERRLDVAMPDLRAQRDITAVLAARLPRRGSTQ
jgi:crossover junction endodeoxyribonuclease RuvC